MDGLFDIPGRLLEPADAMLASALPSAGRIVVWAVVAGLLSMALYGLLSPQSRIARAKAEVLQARCRLEAHTGALADAAPLMRAQLAAAVRQLGLVLPASLMAAIPVIGILVWADTRYGYVLPDPSAADPPAITVTPAGYTGAWSGGPAEQRVAVADSSGVVVLEIPVARPVPAVEKRRWWNRLFGNPLGYLPADGAVERVELHLGTQRHLPFGPDWLGSWLALFMPALALTSFAVMRLGRLH